MRGFFLFLITGLFTAQAAFANDGCCDSRKCADALGKLTLPQIRMFNSGRDVDLHEELRKAAEIIYQDIAPRLGLKIPDMVIKSLSATDMAALTANSGHPAPHWYDGQQVMGSAKRAGNILEFVETGRETHTQYVRDVNTLLETLIVYAHVVGHYDFAETSFLFRARQGDRIRDSHELATYMNALYEKYDGEEVDQFYQWLLSLKYLQDLSRGSFQHPDTFVTNALRNHLRLEVPANPIGSSQLEYVEQNRRFPSAPSPSVLQSFVRNLDPKSLGFKEGLIERFEKLQRVFPAIMMTKIMNEGWATLMEYIILFHSPWNDGKNLIDFAAINAGVTHASLQNPYWLGLQAWLRIRERFLERPENQNLQPFEEDRRFIAYAREIIRDYNDFEFLQMALDETWFERHQLLLYRKATDEEAGRSADGDKNIAITRDPRRIARYIAKQLSDFTAHLPVIEIVDFNFEHSGTVLLKHQAIDGVPLKRESVAKTAYVISKILERPVRLETIGTNLWNRDLLKAPSARRGHSRRQNSVSAEERNLAFYQFPMGITVYPSGDLKVDFDSSDEKIRLPEDFLKALSSAIQAYQDDLHFTYPSVESSPTLEKLIVLALESHGPAIEDMANSLGHAPTASLAAFKYQQLLEKRAHRIMTLAAQGKWPIRYSGDGKKVRIQLFPEIPRFELDERVKKKIWSSLPPTPVERGRIFQTRNFSSDLETNYLQSRASSVSESEDRDLEVGVGPYSPGQIWDRPPPQGQGEGDGEEGEGDPSEGDPQAGEGAGEMGEDSGVVEIPIEIFAEMLADQFELRNLRKLESGRNRLWKDRRGASLQNPEGVMNEERTAENDIMNGVAIIQSRGEDYRNYSISEIFEIGLRHRSPADHIVAGRVPVQKPEMDAVIIYVADTSGSMGPEHRKVERKMVSYISAVLRSVYPILEERFVIYDTEALEVNRDDFFSRFQGGGTQTTSGLEVAEEILKDYPRNRFNRYIHLFSDGGDFDSESAARFVRELIKEIEYFGYGHVAPTSSYTWEGEMTASFEALAKELKDHIGFARLDETHQSLMEALRIYYGKPND